MFCMDFYILIYEIQQTEHQKLNIRRFFFLIQNSKALLQSYSKHDQVCNSNTPFLVVTCPSYSYYCSDETPWFKKKVWEKGFIWLTPPQHLYLNGESQKSSSNRGGTCRHKVIQQPWRDTADWVVPHGFLSPVIVPPTIGWTLPSWSLIKKLPYTQVLLRYVFNRGSLLSGNSSFYQVVKK